MSNEGDRVISVIYPSSYPKLKLKGFMNSTFQSHLVIKASAGTGKTYQLTTRYLQLLANNVAPSHILATTFTRKAAFEIKERLFIRLAKEVLGDSNELITLLGKSKADVAKIMQSLVAQQHRILICTMDSFCIKLARSFEQELGLANEWCIASEAETKSMLQSSLESVLLEFENSDLSTFFESLVEDNASRRLTEKLDDILEQLLSVLQLSETEDWTIPISELNIGDLTADVIVENLNKITLPKTKTGIENKTWAKARDSLSEKIKKAIHENILQDGFISACMTKGSYYKIEFPDNLKEFLASIAENSLHTCITRLNRKGQALYNITKELEKCYTTAIIQKQCVSFQDIKYLLRLLFEHYDTSSPLLADVFFRTDSKLQHILLDEFQDTSLTEWRVIEPFVNEVLCQEAERSFFCVGDVKQAIYGWRGGEAGLFNELTHTRGLAPLSMEACRRCAPQILTFSNILFSNLDKTTVAQNFTKGALAWHKEYSLHHAENDRAGFVEVNLVSSSTNNEEQKSPGEEEDANENAVLLTAMAKVYDITQKQPAAQIGILVRTNETGRKCGTILSRKYPHIYFTLEGGQVVAQASAVRVIMSCLMLYEEPENKIFRFTLATSQLGQDLGYTNESWECEESTQALHDMLGQEFSGRGLSGFVTYLVSLVAPHCNSKERRTCNQLIQLTISSKAQSIRLLLDLVKNTRITDHESSQVTIMTVHKAKGLEFDAVVLPDLNQELVPARIRGPLLTSSSSPIRGHDPVMPLPRKFLTTYHPTLQDAWAQHDNKTLYESLSVLYVAITRAKHSLFIFIPEKQRSNSSAKLLCESFQLSEATPHYTLGTREWHNHVKKEDTTITEPLVLPSFTLPDDYESFTGLIINQQSLNAFQTEKAQESKQIRAALVSVLWLFPTDPIPLPLLPFNKILRPILTESNFPVSATETLQVWLERPFAYISTQGTSKLIQGVWQRVVIVFNGPTAVRATLYEFKLNEPTDECYSQEIEPYGLEALRSVLGKNTKIFTQKIEL
jgi:ATP-dependent helicase/nuclease subunit A